MDSSGLSSIMKGIGGCVVGYEFTCFASTIITASYFWWRRIGCYLQLHGTAMGTKMAPAYANLFMGDLEQKLLAQSPLKPLVWWRLHR